MRALFKGSSFALALVATVAVVIAALPALAASPKALSEFNATAFEAAQAQGKLVVLDFYAPWCPVCRRQHKNLEEALGARKNSHIVSFLVNYDDSEELRKRHNVEGRSTLILFRGASEIARIKDSFTRADIDEFLAKAVAPKTP
jgi:thioredoxin 1